MKSLGIFKTNQFVGLISNHKIFDVHRHIYLPDPSPRAVYDTRSIFKRSLTGLNSEFS